MENSGQVEHVLRADVCNSCGLYKKAKSYCIKPEFDLRDPIEYPGIDKRPPILIVGSNPGSKEDELNVNFCSVKGGGYLLRRFLEAIETKWILTNGVRCFPGREEKDGRIVDAKPTDRQAMLCGKQFIQEIIAEHKPKVIICLGTKAAKSVLGKAAPKKIMSAKAPIPVPGLENCWALVTNHPLQHDDTGTRGGTDLYTEYERVFDLAEKVIMYGYNPPKLKYTVVRSLSEARNIVSREMASVLSFSLDIETEVDLTKSNPENLSIWHPGAKFLCMAVTWKVGSEYINYVFPAECVNSDILIKMCRGKIIKGHNIKYEIQGLYRFFGVDILVLAKDIIDTLIRLYLPDHDRADLGLKDYCQQKWGVPNWETMALDEIEEANTVITVKNKFISANNRRKQSLIKRKLRGETHYKVMVPNPDKPGKRKGILMEIPSMEELKPENKIPANSANFSHINKNTLWEYNAHDTFYTEKIDQESDDANPDPLAWEHNRRAIFSLSKTERRGLPVNKERLRRLKNSHAFNYRELQATLLSQVEVQVAIEALPSYADKLKKWERRGFVFRNELLDLIKPKGYKFYEQFVAETVGLENFPRTEKGRLSAKAKDLFDLAKVKKERVNGETIWVSTIPEEERTRTHDLWRLFLLCRKSQDMQAKFLDSFLKYVVDGRIRTSYRMTRIAKSGRSAGADETGGASSGRLASCIAEGTYIDVPRDRKELPLGIKIEDIASGSCVFTFNKENELELKRILKKECTGVRETISIIYTTKEIIGKLILTPEHKVLTVQNGWTEAQYLLPGILVLGCVGGVKQYVEILAIQEGPFCKVYDLLVEDTGCFIANGVVVHNSDPNLQNLAHDLLLRSCIEAPLGKYLVEFDYDRIEPVVLTNVAGIKVWKDIFTRKLDLYRVIANKVLKLGISLDGPDDEVRKNLEDGVTDEQRELAKTSTLAIMYEQTAKPFAERMGIPEERAVAFFKEFNIEFPEIQAYKEMIREAVRNGELIKTLFGRKRSFPLLGYNIDQEEQYRRAINFNIQASASDITLWKLFEIYAFIEANNLEDVIYPINIVHDAIWFEVDKSRIDDLLPKIAGIMEDMSTLPFNFDIPLLTTIKFGENLGKMKKYKFKELIKV